MALEEQTAFYETIREDLEDKSFGKWAVVANGALVGVYGSNREASEAALPLLKQGACLVRHVGYSVQGVQGVPLSLQIQRVPNHVR